MSYTIIFETKIVKLADGRFLHLSLQGCNNDDAGRTRDDFHGKIYTEKDFKVYIENLKKHSKPMKESEYFDLKIGSRYVTQYDYAEHLERMMKRATTWDELIAERSDSHGKTLNKVTVFTPATGDTKEYSALEWKDVCYDVIYGNEKSAFII